MQLEKRLWTPEEKVKSRKEKIYQPAVEVLKMLVTLSGSQQGCHCTQNDAIFLMLLLL